MKVPARGKALVPTDLSIAVPQGTYARIGIFFLFFYLYNPIFVIYFLLLFSEMFEYIVCW